MADHRSQFFCLARRTAINMTAQLRAYVDRWRSGGALDFQRAAFRGLNGGKKKQTA